MGLYESIHTRKRAQGKRLEIEYLGRVSKQDRF